MAADDSQPPPSPVSSSSVRQRHDSFSSSTSDGSSAPFHSLDDSSSSLSEARSSSIPSSAADPPVGQPTPRQGSRRPLSNFRSSSSSEKRQSLLKAQLDKKSFGDKLKFALDLSFAAGDPNRQVRAYQEPVILRSGKAKAIEISRSSSRPSTATSISTSVVPSTRQSDYTSKPFAFRRKSAPEPRPEPDLHVPDVDTKVFPVVQTHVDEPPASPRRPSSRRLAHINNRLEQQLELPPVVEEEAGEEVDEMGFVRSLATRFQRTHTPPNNGPAKVRPQISLPLELVSASNNIVYDAPDIAQHERVVSTSTQNSSGDESETSVFSDPGLTDSSSISSDSSPNASSADHSPSSANFDAAHTSYYNPVQSPLIHPIPISPLKADLKGPITVIESGEPTILPPAVPQRAMSHSKREHVRLARARSMRSRSASRAPSDGLLSHQPSLINLAETPEPASPMEWEHPFGTELAQLDQMAEELALAAAAEQARRNMVEDHAAMANAGLEQYTARDYQFDLDSLISELSMPEESAWERAAPRPLVV